MIHVTLLKPNAMQKLDGINTIIQLKVQNHRNTFKATSATVSHGVISNAPKNAKTRKNIQASCIALWKPILPNKSTLRDYFYLVTVHIEQLMA